MFLGFFAWYAGLAKGGIARVSQVQLIQPLLSVTWAVLFLHESADWLLVTVAVVVLAAVAGSRRSIITVKPLGHPPVDTKPLIGEKPAY